MMMEVALPFKEVHHLQGMEARYDYLRVYPVRHLRVTYVSAIQFLFLFYRFQHERLTSLSTNAPPPTVIASAKSGHEGSSGTVTLSTGASNSGLGTSGSINLNTGNVFGGATGGISIAAGTATDTVEEGGSISLTTGHSEWSSSGSIRVQTANGGAKGNSGEVSLSTGNVTSGNSGPMLFESGSAEAGSGG